MRKLHSVLLGALILPAGLIPSAAFAGSLPTPTPTVSVTAAPDPTVAPTPTSDPVPPTTSAPDPTTTLTPTPDPTDPGDPDEEILDGTFTMTPSSGKAGTTITMKSKTACVDAEGTVGRVVEIVLTTEAELEDQDAEFTVDKAIDTDAKGAWNTTVKVPKSAKVGEEYLAVALCYPTGSTYGDDSEPFLIYDPQVFTVTGDDKAPVADPVPGDPDYTG